MWKFLIAVFVIFLIILGWYFVFYNNGGNDGISEKDLMMINVFFSKKGFGGNLENCEKVYHFERKVLKTNEIEKAVLEELFKGPIESEQERGYKSFFSEETKDILKGIEVRNRTAYVNFIDIRNLMPEVSSKCGSEQFLSEIETTLKQFSTIDNIIYLIEGDSAVFYEWIQRGCGEEDGGNCNSASFE